MRAMSLREITEAVSGTYVGPEELLGVEAAGVVTDSRKVEEGYLFVALRGARVDGHTFVPQVMEKGALCTLVEEPVSAKPFIQVASCEQALKDLAEHYRKALNIKVVGISGSVGKTSTKEMIAAILSQKYNVLKTEGNFNNEIGVPLTIFRIREEHEVAVLEMGISDFGEMTRLARMTRPDICVITNIGYCHLENLGDRDGILKAKTEMFAFRNPEGAVILNGDDDKLIQVQNWEGVSPKYFGVPAQTGSEQAGGSLFGEQAEATNENILSAYADHIQSLSLEGIACRLHLKQNTFDVKIPIPGEHMVYNALAGALVGEELGLTPEEIQKGIESLMPVAGRNHLIRTDKFLILDDCYNANPVSTCASLDVLAMADSRRVAILGDMFELGADEKKLHEQVGRHAAEKEIELLICIGALSRETAKGALKYGGQKVLHFGTKQDFFAEGMSLLKEGDAILVKASHGMEFPEIVDWLQQI